MQKFGADLEDVAVKFGILLVGYFMSFKLVYNENVVVIYVVQLTADEEAFAARQAEKDLTAIVDMYIGIWVSLLGIIHSEAGIAASVGDSSRATFKNMVHKGTRFQNQEI